jgi:hypothetical protein
MNRPGLLLTICISLAGFINGSIPPLERELNLVLSNEKVSAALLRIQDQAGLIFSYRASLISTLTPVSVQLNKKTVREALTMILPKTIAFNSVKNYIILKERPREKTVKKTEISGYVYDQLTEVRVPNVTVYDKNSLRSVTTDDYGYFSISVPADSVKIGINKQDYRDTTIRANETANAQLLNIRIDPLRNNPRRADSIKWKERFSEVSNYSRKMLEDFKGYVNTLNTRDTISRPFQVSILPFIGTNHRMAGNVYNRVSLNLLIGYSRGVRALEVGGLINLVKENVDGFQVAGLMNVVGDSVNGTQLAGLMNINGRSSNGLQAAGLMNINEKNFSGLQATGLMNISATCKGTSVAGLMNITSSLKGAELAGLANVNDTLTGVAAAGLFNVTEYGRKTVQVAGLFNSSHSGTAALQVAGLFNSADVVSGVQLSFLNFADSASGVPLGFLSFVKKGIHQLEISGDEIFYTNLSLRTGVNRFYNIVSLGMRPGKANNYWQIGYGIGTSFKLNKSLRSDITISGHHVTNGAFYFAASEIYKAYWGLEYRLGKKFSVAAGPTFNLYITDALLPDYVSVYQQLVPAPSFSETNAEDYNVKGWVGGRIALRFF